MLISTLLTLNVTNRTRFNVGSKLLSHGNTGFGVVVIYGCSIFFQVTLEFKNLTDVFFTFLFGCIGGDLSRVSKLKVKNRDRK